MRAARLRRSSEIAGVRSSGRSLRRAAFAARALRTDRPGPRIAVTAARAIGSAVTRNRGRRRVREAFRLALRQRRDIGGVDMVVSVRPPAASADMAALVADAQAVLVEATR